ncbi:MAG: hypothetical protein KJ674_01545 [Nanoarchaeota archaeon]|nr:hypothetical protein [Nanoarchaeota archaeon]
MHEGIHNLHLRKRIYEKKEPYPNPDKLKRLVDKGVVIFGIFAQLMTIPQLLKIWLSKNATGVSLVSWIAYTIHAIFFLFYGMVHKDKNIMAIYISWTILDILIIIGILIYG